MAFENYEGCRVFLPFRVGIAGLLMHDRDDEEFRLQWRAAGVGCCRDLTAKSEISVNTSQVLPETNEWPTQGP